MRRVCMTRWTMTMGAAIMITIHPIISPYFCVCLHLQCLAGMGNEVSGRGRRRPTAFWRHDQILSLVRVFLHKTPIFLGEGVPFTLGEVIKGVSAPAPSFLQPETSHTAAYLAPARELPSSSSISFSSSPNNLCLFCLRSETRHQKTRNWLNARATNVR